MTNDRFSLRDDVSVHAWAMFDLRRRTIVSPSGVEFERTFVSTPGAVAVVAITDDDEVVVVKQYRAAFGASVLEIPAGMRDVPGEDPSTTASRELTEETGYTADELHEMFKAKFLPQDVREIEMNGERMTVSLTGSTTALSKMAFTEFIEKIEEFTGIQSPPTIEYGL